VETGSEIGAIPMARSNPKCGGNRSKRGAISNPLEPGDYEDKECSVEFNINYLAER
jgi:hypothetical protein